LEITIKTLRIKSKQFDLQLKVTNYLEQISSTEKTARPVRGDEPPMGAQRRRVGSGGGVVLTQLGSQMGRRQRPTGRGT
jgi:hypothetical protein